MPQPAPATAPQDESTAEVKEKKLELAKPEAKISPEKAALEKAVESKDSGNVIGLFRKDREKAEEALDRLGLDESEANPAFIAEEPRARTIAAGIETAKKTAKGKVAAAETAAVTKVKTALGEKVEAMTTTPAPAAVEAKPVEAAVEAKASELEELEERLEEAAKKTQEDYQALMTFSEEHGLHTDPKTLLIPAMDMDKLSKAERKYVSLLQIERAAGRAEMEQLQMSLDAMKEADPKKKEEMMRSAKVLEGRTEVIEKEAEKANKEYLALPEIAAVVAGMALTTATDSTGGSLGGHDFSEAPLAAPAAPPTGQQPPGGTPSRSGGGGGINSEYVHSGGNPTPSIAVKELPNGEKVEPTLVDNFFTRNFKALGGFFGLGGGGSKEDRH